MDHLPGKRPTSDADDGTDETLPTLDSLPPPEPHVELHELEAEYEASRPPWSPTSDFRVWLALFVGAWAGNSAVREYGFIPSGSDKFNQVAFTTDLVMRFVFMSAIFVGIPTLIVKSRQNEKGRPPPPRSSPLQLVLVPMAVLAVVAASALATDAVAQAERDRMLQVMQDQRDRQAPPIETQLVRLVRLVSVANCPSNDPSLIPLLEGELDAVQDDLDRPMPDVLIGSASATSTYLEVKEANERIAAIILGIDEGEFNVTDAATSGAEFLGLERFEALDPQIRRRIPDMCFPE